MGIIRIGGCVCKENMFKILLFIWVCEDVFVIVIGYRYGFLYCFWILDVVRIIIFIFLEIGCSSVIYTRMDFI